MNCDKFLALEEHEKAVYMASLIHVCQSSDIFFERGEKLIAAGHKQGLFKGIKLFPHSTEQTTIDTPDKNEL